VLVVVSSPWDGAIHILNQYDSFSGVSADPGMYELPDYILLTTIVGRESVEIDGVKFATFLCLSGNLKRWRSIYQRLAAVLHHPS